MHAFCITGGERSDREFLITELLTQWNIHSIDQKIVGGEEEHIGIQDIRLFQKQLQLAPLTSSHTVGIIRGSDRMTPEAQNALLKILEEPPPRVYIVLETQSSSLLLPTVVSRCEMRVAHVSGTAQEEDTIQETLHALLASPIGKKLTIIDTVARDRVSAKQWTSRAIEAVRRMMIGAVRDNAGGTEQAKLTRLNRLLLTASKQLDLNLSPKRVLDIVFLSL
jgi:hypothetical protein